VVDGEVNISDPVGVLEFLFLDAMTIPCEDAADSDDSGALAITDPVYVLSHLFLGGPALPGPFDCGVDPTLDSLGCVSFDACPQSDPVEDLRRAGHLLQRIAYGPTSEELDFILENGTDTYIEQQLNPELLDDENNGDLQLALASATEPRFPSNDVYLVERTSRWRYFEGSEPPPNQWQDLEFDDTQWKLGVTAIGYSYRETRTELEDMRGNFSTIFVRRPFEVVDPESLHDLVLNVSYDDGFVGYLNGTEVARGNVGSIAFNANALRDHRGSTYEEFDLSGSKHLLLAGTNILAIQVHNHRVTSGDFTINAELIDREVTSSVPELEYPTLFHLQAATHARGVYSRRQLQVVLADFWENHFTTDGDTVVDYLDDIANADGTDAMDQAQADREGANLEAVEYEFFLEHALGNFGDLLRFSASSPTMLIYLDNVLNFRDNPNENYAREILELHSFGVDNGYGQADLEEVARVFTGWNVCKVAPENAGDPHVDCAVEFTDTTAMDLGAGWRLFRGNSEPTPGEAGNPTTLWAAPEFDDSSWTHVATGIGYGDSGNHTTISGMRNNFVSIFLRREFLVDDPVTALSDLVLEISYDDGFVAYLNGAEVARSQNMKKVGTPPAFDVPAQGGRDVESGPQFYNLRDFLGHLRSGTNVLSLQVHNRSIGDSDLSVRPRLLQRTPLPGSVDNGDSSGRWTFKFLEDEHDYGSKQVFPGRPWRTDVPARPEGVGEEGIRDGLDFIDALVDAPPTAEFICSKLIRKFVRDDVPTSLLANCIASWNSTTPKGNIREVMETILTSDEFWAEEAYRVKIKDPLEFINSTLRAIRGTASDPMGLPERLLSMGMHRFTRDAPDGWPEEGDSWISANGLVGRIQFAQDLASSQETLFWDSGAFLGDHGLEPGDGGTPGGLIDALDRLLFQGTLREDDRAVLLDFLNRDFDGTPRLYTATGAGAADRRLRRAVALMLSLPQWMVQ